MSLEVSVIVPAYNRSRLITPTLDSILSQSHRPAEIIVVDDGSSDDTGDVVAEYGRGVKYVRIENSGPPRARNVGVAISTAPWLAFCDSDDLWHPEKLSLQVRLFEKALDVEYGFTDSKTIVDDMWSHATKFDSLPPGYWNIAQRRIDSDLFVIEESMFTQLLVRQPIFPSTVMMKRVFFERMGGWCEPLGRNPAEDVEFHLRCVDQDRIGVVTAPVVGIRKHGSNFSGNTLRTRIGDVELLYYLLEYNPSAKEHSSEIQDKIIAASADAAECAFELGQIHKAHELLAVVPHKNRTFKLHIKSLIIHSPGPLARLLWGITSGGHKRRRAVGNTG
jgi:glycosyltransferase involved in cell wall biosynthesis